MTTRSALWPAPSVMLALLSFLVVPHCLAVFISVNPPSGPVNSVVNILGSNYDTDPSKDIVYFGAVRAVVTAATPTNLTVLVPAGATYAPVTVTVGGMTVQSNERFLPTFPGLGLPLTSSSFVGQNLRAESGPYQTIIADLDGDGKPDLIVGNAYAHTVSIYRNITKAGSLDTNSFATPFDLPLVLGTASDNPLGLAVADVDGDGKLDILICDRGSNQLLVCRNLVEPGSLTTNSFAARLALTTGNDPRQVRIADLDGDGRQDVVVVNYADSALSVFRNLGAPGAFTTNSFAPRVDIPVGSGPYDIVIADLDGDGKPDIAVANSSASFVAVLRNLTSVGILDTNSFASEVDFPSLASCSSIIAVDVDGDGQLDLVLGSVQGDAISVFRNLSTPGALAFDGHVDFGAPGWVHNVIAADFNGDGKPDIAMDGELGSFMGIFQNGSLPGAFNNGSLSNQVDFPTGWNAWGISAGDLDGDGRPDVVLCNSYDNTLTVYRNVVPSADIPDHFDWNLIPSPRFTTAPFAVTILAHNATNGLVTNFNGAVLLSSTNGVPITPPISDSFTQGVWTGTVAVSQVSTGLVLRADGGPGAVGLSNPFDIVMPPGLIPSQVGNYLLMFWPVSPAGFVLESTPRAYPAHWTPVPISPRQVGDQQFVPVPISGGSQFFRLRYAGR